MKIIACIKRVPTTDFQPRVSADGKSLDLAGVQYMVSFYDEIAVEEALRLREAGTVEEVIAASCGVQQCQETIRTALAMGADRGVLVLTDVELQPLAVAKLLKAVVDKEQPGLVIVGKQAIDDDSNATGQMLAALLGWSQGTFANKLNVADGSIEVKREVDGGLENIKLKMPAVITTDLRLNEPRYASLPNIMKAKKKPIETLEPDALGVDVTPRLKVLKVEEPPKRKGGIKVKTVAELVDKLKN